jgi:hypothetical protein
MNKVILPKEVSKALKTIKYNGYTTRDILRMIHVDNLVGRYESDIATIKQYAVSEMDALLAALVNGYEVEKSAEDKVRDYYECVVELTESIDKQEASEGSYKEDAILQVLNTLGIKIEGVNAGE